VRKRERWNEELGIFLWGASFAIFSQQKKLKKKWKKNLRSVNFSNVNSANLDFLGFRFFHMRKIGNFFINP